jgi:hypothetical protein
MPCLSGTAVAAGPVGLNGSLRFITVVRAFMSAGF